MTRDELQALLDAPVPPVVDDEATQKYLEGQRLLILYLTEKIAQLTNMAMQHKSAIELTYDVLFGDDGKDKLIGFDKPAIIIERPN